MTELPSPTPRELEILKILWEKGPSSVRDVFSEMAKSQDKDLAYNTVQTLLRIMEEKKGLVRHQVEGRTFIYTPVFSRDDSASRFLDRVFDGALDRLVHSLLQNEPIDADELDRIQALITDARHRRISHEQCPTDEVTES